MIGVRFEQICRLAFAVGLSTSLRFFPDADPVRDAGQLRVLERLRARLPSSVTLRTEVPLDRQNDRRAWDAVTLWSDCVDAFEIETRLADIQAVERRVMLKSRDDGVVRHAFLVVADTRANRVALAAGRSALSANFPLDTRPVLASRAMPGEQRSRRAVMTVAWRC